MINCTLPELVKRRMKDYGMTPRQLAEATGIHINNIRLLLAGKYGNPGIEMHRRLVKALDLDPGVIERAVRKC